MHGHVQTHQTVQIKHVQSVLFVCYRLFLNKDEERMEGKGREWKEGRGVKGKVERRKEKEIMMVALCAGESYQVSRRQVRSSHLEISEKIKKKKKEISFKEMLSRVAH